MAMVVLLVIYCALIVAASLAGGGIPLVVCLTHRRMQVAISLVAGVMLGIGLLHLVPHGHAELDGDINRTVLWALVGFLVMFFLERFFHFHHHEAPDEAAAGLPATCRHDEEHDHDHSHFHSRGPDSAEFSWLGAFFGMTLHSLIDGLALAAAVKAESHSGNGAWLAGFGTFLAVFLHKPFDALTIGTLMAAGGHPAGSRRSINWLYALMPVIGVVVFYLGAHRLADTYPAFLGSTLCFAGGAFLCIATSDLLPELQFHSHDRFSLSVALLLGIAVAWAIVFVEGDAHVHHHPAPESHRSQPLDPRGIGADRRPTDSQ